MLTLPSIGGYASQEPPRRGTPYHSVGLSALILWALDDSRPAMARMPCRPSHGVSTMNLYLPARTRWKLGVQGGSGAREMYVWCPQKPGPSVGNVGLA